VSAESDLPAARCVPLVVLAARLRALKGVDLEEGCSTRLLVYCATLMAAGLRLEDAVRAAVLEPLTDDPEVLKGLLEVARMTLG
jgi:nitric oxide reductase NorQ protein